MNNNKWWWWWWCRCYNKRIVDNYPDDKEDEYRNLQTNEETEPSDEVEINELVSGEKQLQETNNSDQSNDDSDARSEEGGSVHNEDRGDRQVAVKSDDEAAEEEQDDQDEEEEENDEGEDTQSVKTYVKNIIPFDDDDRNPHANSSPKGNITILLKIVQSYCWLCYKGANIINCIFAHFS